MKDIGMSLEETKTTDAAGVGEGTNENEAGVAEANAAANVGDGAVDPQLEAGAATAPAEENAASTTASSDASAQGSVGEDPQPVPAAEAGAGAQTAASAPVEKGELYDDKDALLAAIDAKPGEKVSKEYMESRMKAVSYAKIDQTVTVCSITLDNGFSVRGESACVDPANFDEKIGRTLAYNDAFSKLWALFGFRLAEARFLRSQQA